MQIGMHNTGFMLCIFEVQLSMICHKAFQMCRAYNKLTSSALKWQNEAPSSEAISLKQVIANKALKGLGSLHQKVTNPSKRKISEHAASSVPPPVAPLPWQSKNL